MRGVLVVALAAILLSGCATVPAKNRNIWIRGGVGAGIGAGVGAIIGSAYGGPPGGWVGAAIGAAYGSAIGSMVQEKACYFRNKSDELWQVPCNNPRINAEACFVSYAYGILAEVPCPTTK